MVRYSKAQGIRLVLEALAYHDFDLLNEGTVAIWKYDHADFGSKSQLSAEADKQTDKHIELHQAIPDDKTVHDDWCVQCTSQLLSGRFGEFGKDIFAVGLQKMGESGLSEKEGALKLATRAAEVLEKLHDEKMRSATRAVKTREALGQPKAQELEALVEGWTSDEDRVTDYYALWLGSRFPGIVDRAEQLRVIPARGNVPETVQRYFLEATRSYIFGQYLACLVVCRAAIELALGDFLLRNGKEAELQKLKAERRDGFSARLDLARSLGKWNLKFTLDSAREISKGAGTILHERNIEAERCKDLFFQARGVLKELYA